MTKRFSIEFKQQAVNYALQHSDKPIKEIAVQLGIGYSTLDRWVRDSHDTGSSHRPLSNEQQRILQLERENKELRQVNDILKKAHVYFVNNPSK